MKINLTPARIKGFRPKTRDQVIWDTAVPHFGVRIRSNGTMSYVYISGVNGKAKKTTLGNAKLMPLSEARETAARLNIGEGFAPPPPVSPLFKDFIADVWWPQCTASFKPNTKRGYRLALKNHLLPAFGDLAMTAITKTAVLNWFDRYSRNYPGGANRVLVELNAILNQAVKAGVLTKNPAKGIIPNQTKKMIRFLSDGERARLLAALDQVSNHYQAHVDIIRLLLFTGCRKSEVLHLRWDEVAENTLTLTDSKTGPRLVWMGGEAMAILERQRQNRVSKMASPYVFPHRDDAHKCIENIYWFWHRLRRRIGLSDIRLHDLRHSFASQAVRQGVSLPVLSKLLGHSNLTMTMRYAHLSTADIEASAKRIAAIISGQLEGGQCG